MTENMTDKAFNLVFEHKDFVLVDKAAGVNFHSAEGEAFEFVQPPQSGPRFVSEV